jgi:hypothetical protein
VAAIEQSRNVTINVLDQYVHALGGSLQLTVVQGRRRVNLFGPAEKVEVPRSTKGKGHAKSA